MRSCVCCEPDIINAQNMLVATLPRLSSTNMLLATHSVNACRDLLPSNWEGRSFEPWGWEASPGQGSLLQERNVVGPGAAPGSRQRVGRVQLHVGVSGSSPALSLPRGVPPGPRWLPLLLC